MGFERGSAEGMFGQFFNPKTAPDTRKTRFWGVAVISRKKILKKTCADGFKNIILHIIKRGSRPKPVKRSLTMPVMERREAYCPPEAMNLPEVEYPPEVIARLDAIRAVTEAQIASGELKPMSVAELAAELGIEIDGEQ